MNFEASSNEEASRGCCGAAGIALDQSTLKNVELKPGRRDTAGVARAFSPSSRSSAMIHRVMLDYGP